MVRVHVGKYASHMASMGDTISFQFTDRSGVSCLVGFLQCLTSCKTRMDDTQTQAGWAGWGTTLLGSAAPIPLPLTVTFLGGYHMSIGFQLAREVPKLIVSNDPSISSILRYKSVTTFHSRPSLYHSFSLCLNKRIHPKEERAAVAQHLARQMLPHMKVISSNYLLYISVLRFGMLSPTHHIP